MKTLERIRTFWGRLRGGNKVVVVEGLIWKCTKCHFIFLTKEEGKKHASNDNC